MTKFGATVGGGGLKVFFKNTSFTTETFKFPPNVAANFVIFAHIKRCKNFELYLKSIGSAWNRLSFGGERALRVRRAIFCPRINHVKMGSKVKFPAVNKRVCANSCYRNLRRIVCLVLGCKKVLWRARARKICHGLYVFSNNCNIRKINCSHMHV